MNSEILNAKYVTVEKNRNAVNKNEAERVILSFVGTD